MRKLPLHASSVLVLLASGVLGCAGDDPAVPPGGTDVGVGVGGGGVGGGDEPCSVDGEQRACSVHNAYGCLEGVETCSGGVWSDCVVTPSNVEDRFLVPSGEGPRLPDASARVESNGERPVGHPGGVVNRAVGDPCTTSATCNTLAGEYCGGPTGSATCREVVDCGDDGTTANPCDPECHALQPQPADFAAPGTGFGYEVGDLGALPGGALDRGLPDSCTSGSTTDCQFDHYCESGACEPWPPNEFDTSCSSTPDITLGVPCDDGGGATVPVCNRGDDDLNLSGSDEIEWKVDLSLSEVSESGCGGISSGGDGSCALPSLTLAPGECASVPCAGVPDGAWLKAKVGGDCNCSNNWSWYESGVSCGVPTCGGGVNVSSGPVELSLFVYADRSGTMDDDIGGGANEKVNTVCRGLEAFVETPANAGIRWEYKEWPDQNSTYVGPASCDRTGGCTGTAWDGTPGCFDAGTSGAFSTLSTLPGDSSGFQMPCNNMLPVTATATYTSGTAGPGRTPLLWALHGARHKARIEKSNNPSRTVVIVLVTDAVEVGGTHPCGADIQGEVEDTLNIDRVYTAVVGIGIATGSAAETQANNIANWGGTGSAILLPGGGDPASLNAAMQDIRNSFACTRKIPNPLPSGVTLADIEITLNIGGVPTVIADEVIDSSDCDAGQTDQFYFTSSDEVALCPDTCAAVTTGSNFEVYVPCGPQVVEVNSGDTFGVPDGTCPAGTIPKWTQMIVNGDFDHGSSITVEAHTKVASGDTFTTQWVPITTLTASGVVDLFTPLEDFNDDAARDPLITPPQGYGEGIEFNFQSHLGSWDHDGDGATGMPPTPERPYAPTISSYEVHFTCEATE